jgi:hypothetical protein
MQKGTLFDRKVGKGTVAASAEGAQVNHNSRNS